MVERPGNVQDGNLQYLNRVMTPDRSSNVPIPSGNVTSSAQSIPMTSAQADLLDRQSQLIDLSEPDNGMSIAASPALQPMPKNF